MTRILLYATRYYGFCLAATRLLTGKGPAFEEIDVVFDAERRAEMAAPAGGAHTVLQIFIHGRRVGGYRKLDALDRAGKLDAWLARASEALAAETLVLERLTGEASEP